MSDLIAVESP